MLFLHCSLYLYLSVLASILQNRSTLAFYNLFYLLDTFYTYCQAPAFLQSPMRGKQDLRPTMLVHLWNAALLRRLASEPAIGGAGGAVI